MVSPPIPEGAVLPLVREVTGSPDPLALYAALCDSGRRPGSFLLESAETGAGSGERSLLGVSAALRIVCHGRSVEIAARSANGRSLLPWIAAKLSRLAEECVIAVHPAGDLIRASFPAPPPGPRDEASRGKLASPLDALRAVVFGPEILAHPTDACYLAAGVFSYDLIELFEDLPAGRPERTPTPHFEFFVPDRLIIVDHVRHRTLLVANAFGRQGCRDANYHDAVRAIGELVQEVEGRRAAPPAVVKPPGIPCSRRMRSPRARVDLADAEYQRLVQRLKQHIVAGDVFQIVASRTLSCPAPIPSPPMPPFARQTPVPTSSIWPARPRRCSAHRPRPRSRCTARPSGSPSVRSPDRRPRPHPDGLLDPDLDARREAALRLDEKETAEHMMLVDLARNDVARVSRPGTRQVTRLLTVDRYAHVMHLVSEVSGELAPGYDALHAYAAAMNMGTLVGAPKIRAAQLLREVELSRRGRLRRRGGIPHPRRRDGHRDRDPRRGGAGGNRLGARGRRHRVRLGPGIRSAGDPPQGGRRAARHRGRGRPPWLTRCAWLRRQLRFLHLEPGGRVRPPRRGGRSLAQHGFGPSRCTWTGPAISLPACWCFLPGPGTPSEAGCCIELVRQAAAARIPLFGVCLGHQAMVQAFGGVVGPAGEVVHGKTSRVRHEGGVLFEGVPSPFPVGRYHSLAATVLPDCLSRSPGPSGW